MNHRTEVKLLAFTTVIWIIRVVLALIYKEYTDSPFHFIVLFLTAVLSTILFIKRMKKYRSLKEDQKNAVN